MTEAVKSTDCAGKSKIIPVGWTALSRVYRRMLGLNQVRRHEKLRLLRMLWVVTLKIGICSACIR